MNTRNYLRMACIFALLLASSAAFAQRGARTAPKAIDELAQEADTIVRGHVTSARVEPHPQLTNLMTVVVTMTVESTLKGSTGKTLEFRQYIWDLRDQLDAARYKKGQELLLLLGPKSKYGLRSPVGLDQGRFRVVREADKAPMAVNSLGNVGLLDSADERVKSRGIKVSARTSMLLKSKASGPLPLADLEEAMKSLSGVSR